MAGAEASILLIDHGDLPSLAAAVTQTEPSRVLLWHPRQAGERGERLLAAAGEHAELLGIARPIVTDRRPPPDGGDVGEGLAQAMMLLEAAWIARGRGGERIVWPVQVGPDATAVTELVDRATIAGDLVESALGGGASVAGPPIAIDLPLVDLADDQVVDLAEDCGAPMWAFWPCDGGGEVPCGTCGGCRRWQRAFREVGLPWPWVPVAG